MVWALFNAPIPVIKTSKVAMIQDECGHLVIDEEYVNLGMSEGWLRKVSYYVNDRGELVFVYQLVP